MNHTNLLFSKIADENNVKALTRHNIRMDDMMSEGDRATYSFIESYAKENGGQAPSYATLASECKTFDYTPQVSDSFEYLSREIKKVAAQQRFVEYVNGSLGKKYQDMTAGNSDIHGLIDMLIQDFTNIKEDTRARTKVGIDIVKDSASFMDEYYRRKRGESAKIWKSKFRVINEAAGGYVGGNIYVPYGKSGRGKSIITAVAESVELAFQGATVLLWSMEMTWFEVLVRLYVEISGRLGLVTASVRGIDMAAGFDSGELRRGNLSDDFESSFLAFIENLDEYIPGKIIVRSVDDEDFNDRSLRALETDILQTEADVVVLDPFYLLDYEKNTSKTTGGDAAATSQKLRRIAGTTKTVIFAITQADETDAEEDEDGNRELSLPRRKDVAKTKALLQDAYLLIAIDTDYKQGRGIIGLNKGRDGGEGDVAEILFIPNVGIVKQPDTGPELVHDQFML